MKCSRIFSSFLIAGALSAADDVTRHISLEVPAIVNAGATLRVVVRGPDGAEAAVSEALVVDVLPVGSVGDPLATITVQPGQSAAEVVLVGHALVADLERNAIHGLIRIDGTGMHAGEIIPTPAATTAAN
jgi:hypothetical protein